MWKAVLSASLASLAFAAGGWADGPALPSGWTHAEINFFLNHSAHTLVLDRGRVTTASATSLTLRESDGTPVQVALDANTQVTVDGQPGQVTDIRRGDFALTQRIDGGPARQVRLHVPARLARLTRR